MPKLTKKVILCVLAGTLAACGKASEEGNETLSPPSAATPAPSSRPASFGMCAACHSDEPGRNGLGPSLHGIIGRQAGSVTGYAYSPALKASGIVWDEAELGRFIEDPRAVIPGTKMTYAGLRDPARRAEITAYLATLK